ncbi:T9SS type A sorting domain-containing protein, partial [Bacteroidales bacterium OttesenSCG-928-A14]|nr:T9SS type A sorting domain-containing protein [Bacteroidales bacterium OttesenSCG-928-A14]
DIISVSPIMKNDCNIFPNPVDDILNIVCLNKIILRIEILDNSGKCVYNQPYRNKIDMSSFSKGLYFLMVYDINKQFSVFKIIKK